jgi:hypothetical protein
VTERKPTGMSFATWIDQQISEAADRGAFDDLPGAGQPLPRRDDDDDGQAWLREWVRREGVEVEEMLPVPLRLRKERERLVQAAHLLPDLDTVRAAVADLNRRITEFRRIPVGPPVFVPLADEDAIVAAWHAARPSPPEPEPEPAAAPDPGRRPRWRPGWRRVARQRQS